MLELFKNLAKSLDEAQNASGIAGTLREFFCENFNTEDCKIFILDEKQNCIKSFENNNPAETFDSSDKISEVFNVISDKKIVIKNNLLYYELPEHGRSIGLLSFKNGDFERLKEFLKTASFRTFCLHKTCRKILIFMNLCEISQKLLKPNTN